ncbi:lytic transglycosylase domain-containing protein [Candidatus Margulisiibacteriota bacterium]
MDATGIIVILIFVVTIVSASTGGNIGFPGDSTEQRVPIHTNVNVEKIPESSFVAVSGENVEDQISDFIVKYTSKGSRKVSYWTASMMASSMVRHGGRYDVNPKLICALIARESAFNSKAVSSSGAMGLGQLLPTTADALKVTNAFDPDQNIKGTTRYVSFLLDKWKSHPHQVPLTLASYAEGHNGIRRKGGYTMQSKRYVEDIIRLYWKI